MSMLKLIILASSEIKIAEFDFAAHDNTFDFVLSPVRFVFTQGG